VTWLICAIIVRIYWSVRPATVTAPAAIEIGRVLDVAQREAQDIATSIAAAVSQRNV
jgi:hypothetical protein